jgi:transcriptional regulator with XRE-family HTH domain
MHFGQYIKELRLSKEIGLSDAARVIGVTPQFLCDLESGRRSFAKRPNLKLLQKFADIYDHPYSSLVKNATLIHQQRVFIIDLLKELEPKTALLDRLLFEMCIESKRFTPELEELAAKSHAGLQDIKLSLLSTRKVYGSSIKREMADADELVEIE